MRTIKSQDGRMIVNAEKVNRFRVDELEEGYEKEEVYERNFCRWRIFVIFDVWTKIAEYSTEKRALRVLDELNEWLTMQRTYSSFQMPQDGEGLDA